MKSVLFQATVLHLKSLHNFPKGENVAERWMELILGNLPHPRVF